MTKSKFLLLGLMSLFLFPISSKGQQTKDTIKLNLDQLLEIALTDNLSIKIANVEIEKQSYARKSTYSALYPQIDITGAYQRTLKKQVMYIDAGGQTTEASFGKNNTWNATASLTMPLVNPQLWKTLQISDLDVDLAIEKSRSSKLDMVFTVTKCYYTVLLAHKSYEILQIALDNAKINYENIKSKYENGLASEYDMIRANVEVSSYEPQVFSAQNAIKLALWQLKQVVGMSLDIPLECDGNLEDYQDLIHKSISDDFSLENNTTLRQLNIQLDQMQKTVQLYKRAYIPTLGLSANFQGYAMDNTFNFSDYHWIPYSTASLGLNIPVFSGMKRLNDIRKAKTQLTQMNIQKEDATRELYVSAKQIISSMETYVKQYDAANKTVDQAIRGYQISRKRYDTGKGTILEVNDSQLAAVQAALNLDQAIYDYLIVKAQLDKIIGSTVE